MLVLLTILVAAFVALHPYLDASGLCGSGGCQEASQASHAPHAGFFSAVCVGAVLAASAAAAASPFAAPSGRRRIAGLRQPVGAFLPPDTPPPIPSLGL